MINIIIPVFNGANTIEETVKSALLAAEGVQSEIQLILVNDGSYDETLTILEKLRIDDRRITVTSIENSGPNIARNTALSYAESGYVMFLDSDDRLMPGSLRYVEGLITKYRPDMVCLDFVFSDHEHSLLCDELMTQPKIVEKWVSLDNKEKKTLSGEFGFICWNKVYRVGHLIDNGIRFPPRRGISFDLIFVIDALLTAKTVLATNFIVVNSIKRSGSFSREVDAPKALSAVGAAKLINQTNDRLKINVKPLNLDRLYLKYCMYILGYMNKRISFETYLNLSKEFYCNCSSTSRYSGVLRLLHQYPVISKYFFFPILNKLKNYPQD